MHSLPSSRTSYPSASLITPSRTNYPSALRPPLPPHTPFPARRFPPSLAPPRSAAWGRPAPASAPLPQCSERGPRSAPPRAGQRPRQRGSGPGRSAGNGARGVRAGSREPGRPSRCVIAFVLRFAPLISLFLIDFFFPSLFFFHLKKIVFFFRSFFYFSFSS